MDAVAPRRCALLGLVAEHYPKFRDRRTAQVRPLPGYVKADFGSYLTGGLLDHCFLRLQCESCQPEKPVAFSCKGRAFCPSCGGRRMA